MSIMEVVMRSGARKAASVGRKQQADHCRIDVVLMLYYSGMADDGMAQQGKHWRPHRIHLYLS